LAGKSLLSSLSRKIFQPKKVNRKKIRKYLEISLKEAVTIRKKWRQTLRQIKK
jgi:RNase P subunit RPR2